MDGFCIGGSLEEPSNPKDREQFGDNSAGLATFY